MSDNASATTFQVGDRVRVAKLTANPQFATEIDRYADKVGMTATVIDTWHLYGSDLDAYNLRFDSPEGSILLSPFFADELEAVQS